MAQDMGGYEVIFEIEGIMTRSEPFAEKEDAVAFADHVEEELGANLLDLEYDSDVYADFTVDAGWRERED